MLTIVFLVFFLDMIEIPAIFFLGIWFVKELFNGVGSLGTRAMTGGVAVWAHIAGFAAGGLIGLLWRVRHPRGSPYWERETRSTAVRARMSCDTWASSIISRSNSRAYSSGARNAFRILRSSTSVVEHGLALQQPQQHFIRRAGARKRLVEIRAAGERAVVPLLAPRPLPTPSPVVVEQRPLGRQLAALLVVAADSGARGRKRFPHRDALVLVEIGRVVGQRTHEVFREDGVEALRRRSRWR